MIVKKIRGATSHSFFNCFKSFNFEIYSFLSREPSLILLYQPYIWWNQLKKKSSGQDYREAVLNEKINILIDGFQGSGNTFAWNMFNESQTNKILILHHMHSPSIIIKAIHLNIPIVLTLRSPIDAVLSLISRWPYISIKQGLISYIKFHAKLLPYVDNCVISPFFDTTQNFDQIIRAVNFKFNTKFDIPDVKAASKKFQSLTADPSVATKQKWISPLSQKASKRIQIESLSYKNLIIESNLIYDEFLKVSIKQRNLPTQI